MAKQFLQSQQILKRCFNDVTGKLKMNGGYYTMQDYLNAVYDEKSDSLRVVVQGGIPGQDGINVQTFWGTPVSSKQQLPLEAKQGTLTPVIGQTTLQFYYFDGKEWILKMSSSNAEVNLTEDQKNFLNWGVNHKEELNFYIQNKQKIEQMISSQFGVKTIILQLKPIQKGNNTATPVYIDVNGNIQNIVDEQNEDGDLTTHYKISVEGYVIGLQTYANSESNLADRYFTKQVYEKDNGEYGTTHIYMTTQQYEYFSTLENGKNILKVNYLQSMFGCDMILKSNQFHIPGEVEQKLILDQNDLSYNTDDDNLVTHYRYRILGYVTSVQCYQSNQSKVTDQMIPYIIDYNEGQNNTIGYTDIYITKQAYNQIKSLTYPKNVLKFYYLYQTR